MAAAIKCIVAVCLIFVLGIQEISSTDISNETRLLNNLMTNYSKFIRPLNDPGKALDINMDFSLQSIEGLDDKEQVLTSYGWLVLSWTDEMLQWDPVVYGNVTRIVIPGSEIWLPELVGFNGVGEIGDVSLDPKFRAAVNYDGRVSYVPSFKWKTYCPVDMTSFPFDEQQCNITYGNWVYSIKLNIVLRGITLQLYKLSVDWDLVNTTTGSTQLRVESGNQTIPLAYATLTLRRKPKYYVAYVITPAVIIYFMSSMMFMLPIESGEKVSFGVTVSLSYTVLLLMISGMVPTSGLYQPALSYFIILGMGQTALSLLLTMVVLNVYYQREDKPLPRWTRAVFLRGIACFLCMEESALCVSEGKANNYNFQNQSGSIGNRKGNIETQTESDRTGEADEVDFVSADEWKAVARVLDRLFLLLFILLNIFEIIAFFTQMAG